MRFNYGRRDHGGEADQFPFPDPSEPVDWGSVLRSAVGTAELRPGAGTSLPSTIETAPPEPFDAPTHIYGTTGNDVLAGTALDDLIEDAWGEDDIDGGDGNDTIADGGGSNDLHGGAGNDLLRLYDSSYGTSAFGDIIRTNLIDAGSGDDDVRIETGRHQRLTIDLGTGNDLLTISPLDLFDSQIQIATGAGADRIVLDRAYGDVLRSTMTTLVVSDFTAGAGGDVLDLAGLAKGLLAYTTVAANPFSDGHLRLIQDGADTIVRIDLDGNGTARDGFYIRDVARLTDVSASALTAYNLGGYDPHDARPTHTTVNGTAAGEWLAADAGGSDLLGQGGDDRLTGGVGTDVLDGGPGNDRLDGSLGGDMLRGGDGNDVLTDSSGSDRFDGGAGNDVIAVLRAPIPNGLPNVFETIGIAAGEGDDFVRFEIQDTNPAAPTLRGAALTIDLGGGNDRVELPYLVPDSHLTLGAGQDRVVFGQLYLVQRSSDDPEFMAPLVITDFAAGNGGDILEVDRAILTSPGWNGLTNPFIGGYLSLQQSGADTLVVWDYDGSGPGTHHYVIARLAGVGAASLTAFNFGGYAPNGSASSFTVPGGTSANDHLYGSTGSDVIDGGGGNDIIEDRKNGWDSLSGGDGDDAITIDHYSPGALETVTINAGIGNDRVDVRGAYQRLDLILGAGDDRLHFLASGATGAFITLGAGADVIELDQLLSSSQQGPITITDFATGNGGDRLDWTQFAQVELLNAPLVYNDPLFPLADYNPFLNGDARLIQSGADTLLQINSAAGTPGATQFVTLITFQGTSAASFTPYNIGFATYLPTLDGSAGADTLNGTGGADVILGEAGDDHLNGLGANDILRGLDGADTLAGGAGNDRLDGGLGADTLAGGDDADYLDGGLGRDAIDGGAGDDLIRDTYGADTIVGGTGNDSIHVWGYFDGSASGVGSIDAGDGNDSIILHNRNILDGYAVSLGAGDDRIYLESHAVTLTLGAGRDTISFSPANRLDGPLILSDFTPGDAGDVFDLDTFLDSMLRASDGTILVGQLGHDPFALGYVQLRQDGNDVVLVAFPDGLPDEDLYTLIPSVRFANTTLAQLTAANFGGGVNPHATPNYGTLISASLTIAAGETRHAVNVTPVEPSNLGAHFVYRGSGGAIDVVNHGTVTSELTQAGFGFLAGIYVTQGRTPPDSSFTNAADGHFIVHEEYVDPSNDRSSGWTYGFYASAQSVRFRNDGDFQVLAESGTVTGMLAGYDPLGGTIVNNGSFVVGSTYDAFGFDLGATALFTNNGTITVSALDLAVGLLFEEYASGEFTNAGTITVTTSAKSPYYSIGLFVEHGLGGAFDYFNSGTITADIAFLSADDDFPTTDNVDVLRNSGQINGAIFLGEAGDTLLNNGAIAGVASLGNGNDLYDGRNGTLTGEVDGDGDDDLLLGGARGDALVGGDGNDTLKGGGGADALTGGEGNDILQGDAGQDRLTGGAGGDRFVFTSLGDSVMDAYRSDGAKFLPDLILDFTPGQDRIDLSQIDAVRGTAANDAFTFIGGAAFGHHAGELRFEARDGYVHIYADVNGDGFADMQIVAAAPTIQASDFIL